jgi:hypothetical protein
MRLDSRSVDGLRRVVYSGQLEVLQRVRFTEVTLSGLLEFIASEAQIRRACGSTADVLLQVVSPLGIDQGQLRRLWGRNNEALPDDLHGTRSSEFWRIRSSEDLDGPGIQLMQERFVRSAQQNGIGRSVAMALMGVFTEMCDNVVQHSAERGAALTGMAAYVVSMDEVGFAVSDLGIGMLQSLRKNPALAHLPDAATALHAAVIDHASSRPGHPEGSGFKNLFRNLVDRNAVMRFRSQDAVLVVGDGGDQREAQQGSAPVLPGVQVAMYHHARSAAAEMLIKNIDSL